MILGHDMLFAYPHNPPPPLQVPARIQQNLQSENQHEKGAVGVGIVRQKLDGKDNEEGDDRREDKADSR